MSKPRTILVPRLRMQQPAMVSEDVASLLASLEQGLHKVGPQLQCLLGMLEWQTGQKRSTLFIIMVTLLCIYMVTSKNAPLVCSLVVYLIAAYSSFHNIENSSKSDDSRWIIFWLIFGFFNMMDYFTDQIRENFPLFWLFKLLFLTWCLAPTGTNGVTIIYFHLLYPLFLGVNDHCAMVTDFESGRAFCSRVWHHYYPWAQELEPPARKMEDSGEPARPAAREEPAQASEKAAVESAAEKPPADKKPAGDGKVKTSGSGSVASAHKADDAKLKKEGTAAKVDEATANTAKGSAGKKLEPVGEKSKLPEVTSKGANTTTTKGTKRDVHPATHKVGANKAPDKHKGTMAEQPSSPGGNREPDMPASGASLHLSSKDGSHSATMAAALKPLSQAPTKYASDTIVKSKMGSQDFNEGTYQSHLSSHQSSKNERGAGASSWNDVSLFSKQDEDSGSARKRDDDRRGSSSLLAGSKSSVPIIQPVVQPLFSLYSSPYSSTCGSANNVSGSGQPPAGPYAFGPSYPSYHAGPYYPGCLQRPSLGYNRPRMLLYTGPTQRQKSLGLKNVPSLEESEGDMFTDDPKPARKTKGLSQSSSDKMRDDDGADDKYALRKDGMDYKMSKAGAIKEEGRKTGDEERMEDKKKSAGEEKTDKKTTH
ncbi:uncharacterized protein [Dermacentor andersoni]|uniref:uncharacterized protein isoform X2 n=1 Tax=Dermacentor andersoni TaxID=34620 RepID=UPI0024167F6F|nr:uncharacterized protein LOC126521628 isoform X2 [Dermacentor andersoni]